MEQNRVRREERKKEILFGVLALTAAVILIVLDQVTKYFAVLFLKDKEPFVLINGVFELRYLENRGAAFGIMQNRQYVFVIATFIIVFVLLFLYHKMPLTRRYLPLRFCAVLLCAGAAGNAIDRLRLNYVVDFFYFRLIDFPIFNVADCYVVIACILFALLIFFYYREEDDFRFLSAKKQEERK